MQTNGQTGCLQSNVPIQFVSSISHRFDIFNTLCVPFLFRRIVKRRLMRVHWCMALQAHNTPCYLLAHFNHKTNNAIRIALCMCNIISNSSKNGQLHNKCKNKLNSDKNNIGRRRREKKVCWGDCETGLRRAATPQKKHANRKMFYLLCANWIKTKLSGDGLIGK